MAVGGPSRRLTAKTLKYYGPTYIKCAVHVLYNLPPPDPGVWGCRLAGDEMPATSGSRSRHPGQEPLAGLAAWIWGDTSEQRCQACAGHRLLPALLACCGQAQLPKFFLPPGLAPAVFSVLKLFLPPCLLSSWPLHTYPSRNSAEMLLS